MKDLNIIALSPCATHGMCPGLAVPLALVIYLFTLPGLLAQPASCTCGSFDPVFCHNAYASRHIAQAAVLDFPEFFLMRVHVLENLNLELPGDTIVVLGQDGVNCGESLGLFAQGDTLILNLLHWMDDTVTWYLHGCGRHYLRYEDGFVTGHITPTQNSMSLVDFRNQLPGCLDLSGVRGTQPDMAFVLYPEPVRDMLNIRMSDSRVTGFEIFTLQGQECGTGIQDVTDNEIRTDLSHLTPGVYLVRIKTASGVFVRKILKG